MIFKISGWTQPKTLTWAKPDPGPATHQLPVPNPRDGNDCDIVIVHKSVISYTIVIDIDIFNKNSYYIFYFDSIDW